MSLQEDHMCDVNPMTIRGEYEFQYSDTENCPLTTSKSPLGLATLTIPSNATAQAVLETSLGISSYYCFSATYFLSTMGYFIDAIHGTSSDMAASCYSFFYVQEPVEVSSQSLP